MQLSNLAERRSVVPGIRMGVQGLLGVAAGYALGNIPSADIASRFSRTADDADLRTVGSHNPGALNAARSLGKGWGAAVFTTDVAKGVAAAVIARRISGSNAANIACTAAVVGHCHPATGRPGGKGVATSIGQVLGTFPRYLPLDAAVAVGTAALPRWTQRTWAGTAVASTVWVASTTIAWSRGWSTGIDERAPIALPIAAAMSSAVIARRFLQTPLVDGQPVGDRP